MADQIIIFGLYNKFRKRHKQTIPIYHQHREMDLNHFCVRVPFYLITNIFT